MHLASADLVADTNTLLFEADADTAAIVTLNLCNRGAAEILIRVAVTSGAAPTVADWIEYDAPLPAAGNPGGSAMERTGLLLGAGDRLYVRSNLATCSAVAFGLVEAV